MHGDDMAYLSDAHDGRLYCYYRTRAVVLNTGKNELFSCEAAGYDNTTVRAFPQQRRCWASR